MDAEENEFIGRIIKNNQDNADKLSMAMQGQKTLFANLAKMEQERNYWQARAERAEQMCRELMIQQNRSIDKSWQDNQYKQLYHTKVVLYHSN